VPKVNSKLERPKSLLYRVSGGGKVRHLIIVAICNCFNKHTKYKNFIRSQGHSTNTYDCYRTNTLPQTVLHCFIPCCV